MHSIPGLVIKEAKYGEGNKIITLLTPEYGKIQAVANGARSYKSKLCAGCCLFGYSNFILKPGRDLYRVVSADPIHPFYQLRENVSAVSLAAYFCDLLALTVPEQQPAPEALQLALNTLYLLCGEPPSTLKPVFELRLLCVLGFAPSLEECGGCGTRQNVTHFSPQEGSVFCSECAVGTLVDPSVLEAMRYISTAPAKKMVSFRLEKQAEQQLHDLCERALLVQTGKRPRSLDFWYDLAL